MCANETSPEAWQRLLAAARALLEARDDQMVTAVEWEALRRAVRECQPPALPNVAAGGGDDADDA